MGFMARTMEFVKEVCKPMEESKIITFGDILDLLHRNGSEAVTLYKKALDSLTGYASSSLWERMEDLPVDRISPNERGGLDVWLVREDGEADHDKD